MLQNQDLKAIVRDKYQSIAIENKNVNACCSPSKESEVYNIMNDDYSKTEGYVSEADLSLGCGLPTEFAGIKKGMKVLDLGSGAGNDCFVARAEVGAEGKVIGVDFSSEMLKLARINADKHNYNNVEFREGDIEDLPLADNSLDVVISNCVLNLLPSKNKVFHEIFRVLKPGAHFCISDVVLVGELPEKVKQAGELYAGCVSGAILKMDYIHEMVLAGFENINVVKEKEIVIPDHILKRYLNPAEIDNFRNSKSGIKSITVKGIKQDECCTTEPSCC